VRGEGVMMRDRDHVFSKEERYLTGASYKSLVVGKPGTYGWSKHLRKGTNYIIARWEGGDLNHKVEFTSKD
jgi:hypothetical protein